MLLCEPSFGLLYYMTTAIYLPEFAGCFELCEANCVFGQNLDWKPGG